MPNALLDAPASRAMGERCRARAADFPVAAETARFREILAAATVRR